MYDILRDDLIDDLIELLTERATADRDGPGAALREARWLLGESHHAHKVRDALAVATADDPDPDPDPDFADPWQTE